MPKQVIHFCLLVNSEDVLAFWMTPEEFDWLYQDGEDSEVNDRALQLVPNKRTFETVVEAFKFAQSQGWDISDEEFIGSIY